MRLSLRLVAERTDRPGTLTTYLDDPLLLFVPVRLLLGIVTGTATALTARLVGVDAAQSAAFVVLAAAAFVLVCEQVVPILFVGRDPERALGWLLPAFAPVAR